MTPCIAACFPATTSGTRPNLHQAPVRTVWSCHAASAVGRALLAKTGTALKLVTSGNPLATGLRDLIVPHVTEVGPMQKAISGFISETAIEYRSSPVVVDKGGEGELRAGDRMPDVALSNASSLLDHWTSGRPLAVLLNGAEAARAELAAALSHSDVAGIRSEELDTEGRRQFGEKPSLLLVRPDGYIGFRGSPDDYDSWRAYAHQHAL